LHEVVNGLMYREDGRRLPVAFIPNGTGNDTLFNFGVTTVEEAFAFILKGNVIKMDIN
jgi:diacylglycerol kinase family enzyme